MRGVGDERVPRLNSATDLTEEGVERSNDAAHLLRHLSANAGKVVRRSGCDRVLKIQQRAQAAADAEPDDHGDR